MLIAKQTHFAHQTAHPMNRKYAAPPMVRSDDTDIAPDGGQVCRHLIHIKIAGRYLWSVAPTVAQPNAQQIGVYGKVSVRQFERTGGFDDVLFRRQIGCPHDLWEPLRISSGSLSFLYGPRMIGISDNMRAIIEFYPVTSTI
jgi:hypothetical protein